MNAWANSYIPDSALMRCSPSCMYIKSLETGLIPKTSHVYLSVPFYFSSFYSAFVDCLIIIKGILFQFLLVIKCMLFHCSNILESGYWYYSIIDLLVLDYQGLLPVWVEKLFICQQWKRSLMLTIRIHI